MIADLFFGTDAQQSMLRRSRALYDLVQDDTRLTYYGRGVGVLHPDMPGALDLAERLVAIQGVSSFGHVKTRDLPDLADELSARGYSLTRYAKWQGTQDVLHAADAVIANHPLPEDVTVRLFDKASPDADLAQLAHVSLACGVLPIAGSVLRGQVRPGLGLVALDATGRPVSCAAIASYAHPDADMVPDQCWWGMLATDPSRRGERLALILGAMAIRAGHERFGFSSFMTGVVPGNSASEAVCRQTGLKPGDTGVITIVDTRAMGGAKMTR